MLHPPARPKAGRDAAWHVDPLLLPRLRSCLAALVPWVGVTSDARVSAAVASLTLAAAAEVSKAGEGDEGRSGTERAVEVVAKLQVQEQVALADELLQVSGVVLGCWREPPTCSGA